jgi:hypothetical protein
MGLKRRVFETLKKGCHTEVLEVCGQWPLRSPFECLRVTPLLNFVTKIYLLNTCNFKTTARIIIKSSLYHFGKEGF